MKFALSFAFVFFLLSVSAQFNVEYKNAIDFPQTGEVLRNVWLKMADGGYVQQFKQNPAGVKQATELVNEILKGNRLIFDKYKVDKSMISSLVNGSKDYELLHATIFTGSSVVYRAWVKDSWLLLLSLNEEKYFVMIGKQKDKK